MKIWALQNPVFVLIENVKNIYYVLFTEMYSYKIYSSSFIRKNYFITFCPHLLT